jgi:hypothetical protein
MLLLLVLGAAAGAGCGEVVRYDDAAVADGGPAYDAASALDAALDAAPDAGACVGACSLTPDRCCPVGCNANDDGDCLAVCGNEVTEPGEICDGPKCQTVCGEELLGCFTQSGSAENCDLLCHLPITECAATDSCCPYVGTTGGATCNSGVDSDCAGSSWQVTSWFRPAAYPATTACDVLSVYGVVPGDSYAFTTCAPPGTPLGTGDPVISAISDNLGRAFPAAINDDCTEPSAIPVAAGWSCANAANTVRMSCAAAASGGFILPPSPDGSEVYRLDVTICPYNDAPENVGSAPFFVWWNGVGSPNPG